MHGEHKFDAFLTVQLLLGLYSIVLVHVSLNLSRASIFVNVLLAFSNVGKGLP